MSLSDQLASTVETVRGAVPPDTFARIGASIAALKATGQDGRAVGVGSRIDLPVLQGLDGAPLDIAALARGRPLVLTFYRGGWCPYCNVALAAYAHALPAIEAAGGTIVAVTPELPGKAADTGGRNKVGFPIAIDAGNRFARSLGLVFALQDELRPLYQGIGIDVAAQNGEASHELPIPATYVLDRDGVVAWAFVEADFTRRAEPDEVVAAVGAAARNDDTAARVV